MSSTFDNSFVPARRTLRPQRVFVRSGFTILELVVSLAVAAIILGSLTSAMLLASQILPDDNGPAESTLAANEITQQMAGELYYALNVTDRSAHGVTFWVADRGGDLSPETISYAWSGVAGDPLTRQYNDGSAAILLDNVQHMDLTYSVKEVTEEIPSLPNETGELELSGYEDLDKLVDAKISNSNWLGQCFQPVLPPDILTWRITRFQVPAQKSGGPRGVSMVQVFAGDGSGKPTGGMLAETPMYESDLTNTYTWQELSFVNAPWMAPGDELCVILRQLGKGSSPAEINIDNQGAAGMVQSTNEGASWTRDTRRSLLYHAYGTMTAIAPPVIDERYVLTGAQITLEIGSTPPVRALTSVEVLNQPEVAAP